MIAMPRARSYIDLGDSLESIPCYSWILPHIIACSPPEFIQQLRDMPCLFGVKQLAVASANSIREKPEKSFSVQSPTPVSFPAVNRDLLERSISVGDNSLAGEVILPRASSPSALNSINFPGSWRSLGTVRICKDSAWKQWDNRLIYLLDNYLLECNNEKGNKIVGFAPLSCATIERVLLKDLTVSPSLTSPRESGKKIDEYALKVSVYKTTFSLGGQKLSFWLTLDNMADLDTLEAVLRTAVNLNIEDMYARLKNNSVLGKGMRTKAF